MKASLQTPISREDFAAQVKAGNEAFGWRSLPVLAVVLLGCLSIAFIEALSEWRGLLLLSVFALSLGWLVMISHRISQKLGIQCPGCSRLVSGHHTAKMVMATGACRYCGTDLLHKRVVSSSL